MEKPVRVVHVLGALHRGGAETFVMNVYRHIDRTRLQFDFIIHTDENCSYRKEIEEMGRTVQSEECACVSENVETTSGRASRVGGCPWTCKKYGLYLYEDGKKNRENSDCAQP